MKKNLFIVAHPDDEILGCFGTIRKIKKCGDYVAVAVFSHKSATRDDELYEKTLKIHKLIGVDKTYIFDYVMMKFDKYDRHKITQDVEKILTQEQPDSIYTHDQNDIHNDHRYLSQIVMEASKLPLRGIKSTIIHPITSIYTMEIPSSTDWGSGFIPNSYTEIKREDIELKAKILSEYDDVIRDVPHPRNLESFISLARYRGCQCGLEYAEAYKKVFELRGENV